MTDDSNYQFSEAGLGGRHHVAHGEPAVGKNVAKGVLSPARGDIWS